MSLYLFISRIQKSTCPNQVSLDEFLAVGMYMHIDVHTTFPFRGAITKALFVWIWVKKMFDLEKITYSIFESRSYLTGIIAAKSRRHLVDMYVVFYEWQVFRYPWKTVSSLEIVIPYPGVKVSKSENYVPKPHDIQWRQHLQSISKLR